MTTNAIARMLREAFVNEGCEIVPPGWFTAIEWEKRLKLTERKWTNYSRSGIRAGLLEKKNFKVKTANGAHPKPFYRFTK